LELSNGSKRLAIYVALHLGKSTHLARETLDGVGQRLDPTAFVRIHCSIIVSRKHIDQLAPRGTPMPI